MAERLEARLAEEEEKVGGSELPQLFACEAVCGEEVMVSVLVILLMQQVCVCECVRST